MKTFTLDFEQPIRELEIKINELEDMTLQGNIGLEPEIKRLRKRAEKLRKEVYSKLNRWQHVQLARHPNRPHALDYIERMITDFIELSGDRKFSNDNAVISGFGYIDQHRIAVISQQKGRGTKDNLMRNFAMPQPEGYRKALRIMKLAEKFDVPVLTLIDTPGAYCGLGAEERGQAAAIAENLFNMAQLKVPIIAVVIGEGGSGGALALGVADKVFMLRFSIYSVISPEGCASILYRDASHAQQAADALKLTAPDLEKEGLIDGIIQEPPGGAHKDVDAAANDIKKTVVSNLIQLLKMDPEKRIQTRIDKYAKMGRWIEN